MLLRSVTCYYYLRNSNFNRYERWKEISFGSNLCDVIYECSFTGWSALASSSASRAAPCASLFLCLLLTASPEDELLGVAVTGRVQATI